MKKLLTLTSLIAVLFTASAQTTLNWAKQITGYNLPNIIASATNNAGDLFVVGDFTRTVDFDPSAATTNLTATGTSESDIFIAKYLSNGNLSWARKIGNASFEDVTDIAIDKANNIIISGQVKNTVDMDPSSATNNIGSTGKTTSFMAKYTSTGAFTWAKTFSQYIYFGHLAFDASGRIIAVGKFEKTVDFNPETATNNLTSNANTPDVFIASYNSTGTYLWANKIGSSGSLSDEYVHALCLDASNNIYLTGIFNGTMDFDPSAATYNLTASGNTDDGYFMKLKSDGTFLFAKAIAGTGAVNPKDIKVDNAGNIIIAGMFYVKADLDPSTQTKNLTSLGSTTSDIFVAQYSSTGDYKWAKRIGNFYDDYIHSIELTKNNNILLCGTFDDIVDFNPGTATYNIKADAGTTATRDLFVLSLKNDASFIFAYKIGNQNSESIYSLTINKTTNQYYVTGKFKGTVNFDLPGSYTALSGPAVIGDMFIAKYTLLASGIMPSENNSDNRIFEENSSPISNLNTHISIYPNPANDNITIDYNGFENTNANNIKIYDITGKEVTNYSMNNNTTSSQINISNFESGIYIITIQTQDKLIREKFIKH